MKKLIYSTLFLAALAVSSCKGEKPAGPVATLNSIDSLLALYPDSIPLLVFKADQLSNEYKYYDAIEYAAKAYRLDTTNLESRHLYAKCLNNKQDRSFAEIATAQRHFQYILKRDPKNADVMVELASTYMAMQDNETAMELVDNALRIDKRNRDAYVLKGTIFRTIGKMDLAKSSNETAIQMDSKFYPAYIFLGAIYQSENNSVAVEYYKTAYELNPIPELLYAHAYALEQFGKLEEAKDLYRQLAKTKDMRYSSVGNFHLGNVKQNLEKQIDSALYFYSIAIDIDKDYVEAYHNRAMCYEAKGDYTNARFEYLKALEIDPEFKLSETAFERIRKK